MNSYMDDAGHCVGIPGADYAEYGVIRSSPCDRGVRGDAGDGGVTAGGVTGNVCVIAGEIGKVTAVTAECAAQRAGVHNVYSISSISVSPIEIEEAKRVLSGDPGRCHPAVTRRHRSEKGNETEQLYGDTGNSEHRVRQ
jgi:hypothetical protein